MSIDKKGFSDYICRPYCVFFREGQKEEMACGGAVTAARIVGARNIPTGEIASLTPEQADMDEKDDLLDALVCRSCPFVIDGCDFRSEEPQADAVPCGGFILLVLLLSRGLIARQDIEDLARD
jgi:hypothetical protein